MSARNLLSTLLASVLVFNASCACAALEFGAQQRAHAHHHETIVEPADDCVDRDCTKSCAQSGTLSERESVNLPTFKPDLDWHGPSGAYLPFVFFNNRITNTGPPGNPSISKASTPVRRFDLQHK